MNKTVLAVSLGLSACITGGVFGAAFIGRAVTTRLSQETKRIGEVLPSFEVVDEKVEHGIFRSARETKLKLGCLALTAHDADTQATVPLEFTIRDEISHGLFLGDAGLGLAAIESSVILPEGAAHLQEVIGAKAPLTAHSVFKFDGTFESDVRLVGLKKTFPAAHVELKPIVVNLRGNFGGIQSRVHAEIDSIDLSAESKGQKLELRLKGLSSDVATESVPEGMRYFRPGTNHLQVASITAQGQFIADDGSAFPPLDLSFVDLKTWSDSKLSDGLLALETHFETRVKFNTFEIDKLETQSSLQRIDAKFYEEQGPNFWAAVLSCEPGAAGRKADFLPNLVEALPTLLLRDPKYAFDKFGLTLAGEHAQFSYQVGTQGITQADLDDAATNLTGLLMQKGVAKLSVQLSLGFVERALDSVLAAARTAAADKTAAKAADGRLSALADIDSASVMAMLQLMLPAAMEGGYILRERNLLKASAAFEKGELTLNGKPLALPSLGDLSRLLGL